MNHWRTLLRDADRGGDIAMPSADVQRIRSNVLSAASERSSRQPLRWPRAFVVTATLLVVICASVLTGLQRSTRSVAGEQAQQIQAVPDTVDTGEQIARQQLQFTSPGGTRIIWVFDSQFEVKGALP